MAFDPVAALPATAFTALNTLGSPEPNPAHEAQKVSTSFTALFLEQMLNESVSEEDPLTGAEKSAGIVLSEQMMNRQLAETMAHTSPIRLTIEKQLTYAADAK